MYARGILFGKMKYELGDHSYVRCPENDLVADIEFKVKGYFSGTYNAIGGQIKREKTGQVLYELSGLWSGEMFLRDVVSGHKEILFDATNARHVPPKTRPLEEQAERESQRLWHDTVLAVNARDHDRATDTKSKIEDRQREEAAKRAQEDLEWRPTLFRPVRAGPGQSEEGEGDLDWIINAPVYVELRLCWLHNCHVNIRTSILSHVILALRADVFPPIVFLRRRVLLAFGLTLQKWHPSTCAVLRSFRAFRDRG